MAFQGETGSGAAPPVYSIGMQPGHNAVYPASYGGAAPPQFTAPTHPFAPSSALDYLSQLDQLLVQQRVEMAEVFLQWEMSNSYTVKNILGQQVFVAAEENDLFTLQACGPSRPFTIHLHDNMGQEVLTLTRPLRCTMCCFPCCLQELEVQSPPGIPIGYVKQDWHPVVPTFTVLDERTEPRLKIRGSCCDCTCMSDVVFRVTSLDESSVVGQICKQWGGFMQEGLTDADNFGISFPLDLDVKMKAVMLGACFLIDFMFFESKPQRD